MMNTLITYKSSVVLVTFEGTHQDGFPLVRKIVLLGEFTSPVEKTGLCRASRKLAQEGEVFGTLSVSSDGIWNLKSSGFPPGYFRGSGRIPFPMKGTAAGAEFFNAVKASLVSSPHATEVEWRKVEKSAIAALSWEEAGLTNHLEFPAMPSEAATADNVQ